MRAGPLLFRSLFVCLILSLTSAQARSNSFLSADEVKSRVYGTFLSGDVGLSREPWSECIDPNGKTLFRFDGQVIEGQMSVAEDGLLCFDYESELMAAQSCFRVKETDVGLAFYEAKVPGVIFYARNVQRGIEACSSGSMKLS